MQARQHRCSISVLWVLSRVCCVILFSDTVVTRPGNGGVVRKLLQDRCRHFWQSLGTYPDALIQASKGGAGVALEEQVETGAQRTIDLTYHRQRG